MWKTRFSRAKARRAQEMLARRAVLEDRLPVFIRLVAGVDVAYEGDVARAAAVVLRAGDLSVVEKQVARVPARVPYVPTFLAFREVYPAMVVLRKLENNFDLLFVDGNGRLHPYKAGFALHLGVVLRKPAIGVAKKLLCGEVGEWKDGWAPVYLEGEVVGAALRTGRGRPIYVSVGNMVSLETAVRLARSYTRPGRRLPEPLRIADLVSKGRDP